MIQQSQRLSSSILCQSTRTMEASSSYADAMTYHRDFAASPSQTIKSQSIPISSSHFHRTASEIQLCLDEQIADQRDCLFYSRVVHGIQESQQNGKNHDLQIQNQMCLVHVMQTRADKVTKSTSLPYSSIAMLQNEISGLPEDFEDNCSAVGLPIEAEISSPGPEQSAPDYSQFTIEAGSLAIMEADQDMIFDLDL